MIIKFKSENCIKDGLYNIHPNAGTHGCPNHVHYARGILVGMMSAVIGITGCTFKEAAKALAPHLPPQIKEGTFPDGWENDFQEVDKSKLRPMLKDDQCAGGDAFGC